MERRALWNEACLFIPMVARHVACQLLSYRQFVESERVAIAYRSASERPRFQSVEFSYQILVLSHGLALSGQFLLRRKAGIRLLRFFQILAKNKDID